MKFIDKHGEIYSSRVKAAVGSVKTSVKKRVNLKKTYATISREEVVTGDIDAHVIEPVSDVPTEVTETEGTEEKEESSDDDDNSHLSDEQQSKFDKYLRNVPEETARILRYSKDIVEFVYKDQYVRDPNNGVPLVFDSENLYVDIDTWLIYTYDEENHLLKLIDYRDPNAPTPQCGKVEIEADRTTIYPYYQDPKNPTKYDISFNCNHRSFEIKEGDNLIGEIKLPFADEDDVGFEDTKEDFRELTEELENVAQEVSKKSKGLPFFTRNKYYRVDGNVISNVYGMDIIGKRLAKLFKPSKIGDKDTTTPTIFQDYLDYLKKLFELQSDTGFITYFDRDQVLLPHLVLNGMVGVRNNEQVKNSSQVLLNFNQGVLSIPNDELMRAIQDLKTGNFDEVIELPK